MPPCTWLPLCWQLLPACRHSQHFVGGVSPRQTFASPYPSLPTCYCGKDNKSFLGWIRIVLQACRAGCATQCHYCYHGGVTTLKGKTCTARLSPSFSLLLFTLESEDVSISSSPLHLWHDSSDTCILFHGSTSFWMVSCVFPHLTGRHWWVWFIPSPSTAGMHTLHDMGDRRSLPIYQCVCVVLLTGMCGATSPLLLLGL